MMLDIIATREIYRRENTSNIGLVRSSENQADGVTNPMNQGKLEPTGAGPISGTFHRRRPAGQPVARPYAAPFMGCLPFEWVYKARAGCPTAAASARRSFASMHALTIAQCKEDVPSCTAPAKFWPSGCLAFANACSTGH